MKEQPPKNFSEDVSANTESKPNKIVFRARPRRDRLVAMVPEILWKTEMRKQPEKEDEPKGDTDPDLLETKMLELYALSQEYLLQPESLPALKISEHINDLADVKEVNDDEYFENLKSVYQGIEDQKQEDQTEIQSGDVLKKGITIHKQRIKNSILEIMKYRNVRERYIAELSSERSILSSSGTKTNLNQIFKTRIFKDRLLKDRRFLRVGEFLGNEEGTGKPRSKSVGRTPEALRNIDRGISIAGIKETEMLDKLNLPERGLFTTEVLLNRKRELEEKGFVLSPSREKLISDIVELTAQGYRIFLGGPTGTGKTSVALFALKEMTSGNFGWVTWTGETSVRDLFGSPKITAKESGMTKGPVTKAVIGERSGVLHEELTSGQTGVQMSMKTIWASKAGEQINLPGFNGTEFTKSELIEIATGNLKGKRHSERENMDPAVAREFKAIEVSFMPSEETRDYLILPMLIDRSGLMPLSRDEIDMVTQFCRAAELSQLAYLEEIPPEVKGSDLYKIISPSAEQISLTSIFLDTGTVKDMFSGWRASGKPLNAYLQEGLHRFIEQNPHFKENKIEKETMKNILRAYGFNLDAKGNGGFYSALNYSKTGEYLKPSEMGFLINRALPSEENEFGGEDENGVKDDAFSKSVANRLKNILGKENKTSSIISAEYTYTDPNTKVEKKENIELDIEQKLQEFISLYNDANIDIPPDFEDSIREIWSRNNQEIQQAIEEKGFDDILVVPADLDIAELSEKMKMKNGYYDGISSSGTVSNLGGIPLQSSGVDKSRIILVHKTQNLKGRPELKATLNVKAEDVNIEESLSVEDYIIFQNKYYKEENKYLDEDGWTWTPRTKSGSRFVNSGWSPDSDELHVYADDADFSHSNLGCRPSRYFV